MTGSWWFKLYTRPYLRWLLLSAALAAVADLVLTAMGSYFNFMSIAVPFSALSLKISPGSFRENIEFHKMSVPFRELRRAFMTDVFITALSLLIVLGALIFFSRLSGGFFSSETALPFWQAPWNVKLFYGLVTFIILVSVCFVSTEKKYVFYGFRHLGSWQKFLFLFLNWTVPLVFIVALMFFHPSAIFSSIMIFGAMALAVGVFKYRAIFHRGPFLSNSWIWLKHYLGGGVGILGLFLLCLLLGRDHVLRKDLSVEERIQSYEFSSYLGPKLDRQSFITLEPQLESSHMGRIYWQAGFDPSELGVEYFLDQDRRERRLLSFLYYGKPSPAFLEALYQHLETNKERWREVAAAGKIHYLAFHHWPKGRAFPERFVAVKKSAKDFAEVRKPRRAAASEEED